MTKTPRPSLKELVDQLTERKYVTNPDPSISLTPPYHTFDTWTNAVQKRLLDHLRYYLDHYPANVGQAFQKRLRVEIEVEGRNQEVKASGKSGKLQPSYDSLPDKVFFALIEHDAQWLADPMIQCQIKNWQWLLKASPREFAYLREKLKRIEEATGEGLIPPEVEGAGNFNRRRERVRKLYYGIEGAEWREEDPETGTVTTWTDKAPGVYGWFKDLEQRYKNLPGTEREDDIRITTLLDTLVNDPVWKEILPADRGEALAWLKRWVPRRGKPASMLARKYIAYSQGLRAGSVEEYVKREKRK